MHFKPVLIVFVLALPGIVAYWWRAYQKKKELGIQDTLIFAGNITGFASSLWLGGAAIWSIVQDKCYFNDTHYSLCVMVGLAVARHFALKVLSIWRALSTPNVD